MSAISAVDRSSLLLCFTLPATISLIRLSMEAASSPSQSSASWHWMHFAWAAVLPAPASAAQVGTAEDNRLVIARADISLFGTRILQTQSLQGRDDTRVVFSNRYLDSATTASPRSTR